MVAPPVEDSFPPCSDTCQIDENERRAVLGKPPCAMAEKCVAACAAYGRVCPCAARIAAHYACDAVQELRGDSELFAEEKEDYTYLRAEDLTILEKLGEGGFSHVNHCVLQAGPEEGQEFAVKYLKRRAMVDLHTFKHGAADLAVEAHFLHQLHHPHIVALHGVTAGSVETNFATGKECGFFIVIDRLSETLEKRIERWRREREKDTTGMMGRMSAEYREKKREELMERMRIAHAVARAMEYLHSKKIVFRDLKPDNIGFDQEGVLKIFDFGLAKEQKDSIHKGDGRYEMTGNTGSRRYMAPEVAKDCPYNESVDVYSFGILLWEMCAAEKPYYGFSSGKHMQQVVLGGERPKMDGQHTAHWPANLQWLMKACWSPFPCVRPSFTLIKHVLADILQGKECIPRECGDVEASEERAQEEERNQKPNSKRGMFRASRVRGTSDGAKLPSPALSESFKSMTPPAKNRRARSWGFSLRR